MECTTCILQPIATDDPVACGVCLSRTCAVQKAAERIEILFVVETVADPRNIVLDWGPDPSTAMKSLSGGKFCPLLSTGTLLFGFDAAFTKLLWLLVQFNRRQKLYRRLHVLPTVLFLFSQRLTCDQTDVRHRVKSIPVLRTYVWHE